MNNKVKKQSLHEIKERKYSRIADIAIASEIAFDICPMPEYSDYYIDEVKDSLEEAVHNFSHSWLRGFVVEHEVLRLDLVEINNFKSLVLTLGNGVLICMSKGGFITGHVDKRKKKWSTAAKDALEALLNYEKKGVRLYKGKVESDEFFRTLILMFKDTATEDAIETRRLEEYNGEATSAQLYTDKLKQQ